MPRQNCRGIIILTDCYTRLVGLPPQKRRGYQGDLHCPGAQPGPDGRADQAPAGPAPGGGHIRIQGRRHTAGNRPLLLAFRKRWHLRHGRASTARSDRRLTVFIAAAETNIRQALQQRSAGLLRMRLLPQPLHRAPCGFRSALAPAVPRTAASAVHASGMRSAACGIKAAGGACSWMLHRLFLLREHRRLRRDRPHAHITIGGRLHRLLGLSFRGRHRLGDCSQRSTINLVGTRRRSGSSDSRRGRCCLRLLLVRSTFRHALIVRTQTSGQFSQTTFRGSRRCHRCRRRGCPYRRDRRRYQWRPQTRG